ncbi:DNA-directed RNA polymerase subunit A' [Candidatus Methanoperedens nitroreducens]|uniref:DNA-directed RNA polymerase subunit Rpo1N n=1 Tax=Candidatus Methanoperedens nitratireducens TaxID=1392998 RepID=A0A062VAH3_9EURY|nr:DNA-directed RNA polymerase subunit A' [Candidatus Methanoperedens nitroreducens]KCZ72734.1 DNA-directed RNA polymerase subunit A' [Candidatus Methanoperedens nitroreducens]MDJ1423333.1 DNA-directed RNA polymerase subunit A' [Candidatus Methanoperedens sp.]
MITTPKRIKQVKFGLISPKEFRKMSVTRIITADTYDDDGFPIEMGLMDTKLGVIDPGLRCKTCGGRAGECPGHFGHIELVAPVIHVGFAKLIRKILRATCRSCGALLLEPAQKKRYVEQIKTLKKMGQSIEDVVNEVFKEARKAGKCMYCGEAQQEIKFEKPTTYIENEHKLMPTDIRSRLERITDEDIEVIGMDPHNARPEWTILTVLPVPPVTMRPSITLESGQRSEDDLTHKLVDIIRINQRFQENREAGAPQLIIEDLWELLQYHVTTFIDNAVSGVPPARHRSGRPLKTLSQRLKGKEGRFRGSLSGKRVNFSARTVISPDPNLRIYEVGVPHEIAKELTITLNVTPRNIDEVREYVRRGPDNHPGANYIIRADGRRVKITDSNCEELASLIELGWKVDRQIKDGDVVLFNRQPSLHRMSIMAHEIKVLPYKTFRLNPAVCPPYNADFDGDEMNLHVPQTEEARSEAKILMHVQENILSPRFGGPIIGGIHDHISGLFLLTNSKDKINKSDALELLGKSEIRELPEPAGTEDGEPYWTGKQIFSQILPKGLNLQFKAEICEHCDPCKGINCDKDAYVVIRNGVLEQGTIDEKAIGAFKSVILDKLVKEFNPEITTRFIDDATRLSIRGIMRRGFSFGIDDEYVPPEAQTQIDETMTQAKDKVEKLISAYLAGELEQLPGRTVTETLEMEIMKELSRARDSAGDIAGRHLGMDNSAVIMARSGARGSMLNLTQMAGCVGQQAVRGERIKRGYAGRTLSHFERGDLGAQAHGFVRASYKSGLSPTEYFFHAIGGREGLVDTAVRTSQSGYLQRRLVNALQDLEVQYDGTVRDTREMIIQFKYGEDGINPMNSDFSKADTVKRIVESVIGEVKE